VAVVPTLFRGIEPHPPLLPIGVTVRSPELLLSRVLTQNNNFKPVSQFPDRQCSIGATGQSFIKHLSGNENGTVYITASLRQQ
jgi:hypothetical protein